MGAPAVDRFLSSGSSGVYEELKAYEVTLVVVGLASPQERQTYKRAVRYLWLRLICTSCGSALQGHSSRRWRRPGNKRFEEYADGERGGVGISNDSWSFSCCSLSSIDNLD